MQKQNKTNIFKLRLMKSKNIFLILLLTYIAIYSLSNTRLGTQFLLQSINQLSRDAIAFSGVRGHLSDQFSIEEIKIKSVDSQVVINGLELNWQWSSIFSGELIVNSIKISSLKVASINKTSPFELPKNMTPPISVSIQKIAIGRLSLFSMKYGQSPEFNGKANHYFSAITGQYSSTNKEQRLNFGLTSDWGKLSASGNIKNVFPYQLNGIFTYHGLKNEHVSELMATGQFSGTLQNLILTSKISSQSTKKINGDITLSVKPFEKQIVDSLKIQLNQLNPLSIHKEAPNANLDIAINLKTNKAYPFSLNGQVNVINSNATSIDKNGLPFQFINALVAVNEQQISFNKIKMKLDEGMIDGDLIFNLKKRELQRISSIIKLSDINLNSIDSRIKKTKIKGVIEANNQANIQSNNQIQIKANLIDPSSTLQIDSTLQVNTRGQVTHLILEKFNLISNEKPTKLNPSSITGGGEIEFTGNKKIHLTGEMTQFDPSRWLSVPKGLIGGKIEIKGYLSPNIQLSVLAPEIHGEIEGKVLTGKVNLFWQQNKALDVRQFQINMAGNTLFAEGQLGSTNDVLLVKIDAPHLQIFAPFIKQNLSGSILFNASLKGSFDTLSGSTSLQAQDMTFDESVKIGKIEGKLDFSNIAITNKSGNLQGDLLIQKIKNKEKNFLEKIHLNINGSLIDHVINGDVFFKDKQNFLFSSQGGLDIDKKLGPIWQGKVLTLIVSGLSKENDVNLQLQAPTLVSFNKNQVQFGKTQLLGNFGQINIEHFLWSPGNTQAKGAVSQLNILGLLSMFESNNLLSGNLKLNADWDLNFKEVVTGDIHLQRDSGDVFLREIDTSGQVIPLGIDQLNADIKFGGVIGAETESARATFITNGTRLGQWNAMLETQLSYKNGHWQIHSESPINGSVKAKIPDLQWLGSFVYPELAVKGKLDLEVNLAGKMKKPSYQAKIEGRDLELAFASEGLLLPNGQLSALVSDEIIKLNQLDFTNTIMMMPKHEQFHALDWRGQVGEFHASGEVNFVQQSGEIALQWKQFPLLQRKDRWLVTTGQAKINQLQNTWSLIGKMKADGAYFQLPKLPPPSLSSDVVIDQARRPGLEVGRTEHGDSATKEIKTSLDINLDMGSHFVFVGRGINTPLTGGLRLRSHDNLPVYASGTILAEGGLYEGYGQQLAIERGLLNFQGSPSNPSLNILALRKGLQVEAGVNVTGTVNQPIVRLVSEPNVSDKDKLSWLVLGRESDQVKTMDVSLLLTAAGAILGGDSSRNIPKEFAQKLGFDEFSIGPSENAGTSKLPSQTVAGATTVGASSNEQVVKGSMRLKPSVVLSIESGVSEASGALKLSWLLSRRLRLVGRYGTDRAIDAKYTFSFN